MRYTVCVNSHKLNRTRNSGTTLSTYTLDARVMTPKTSMMRSGVKWSTSVNSESAADANMIAIMFRKLLVAISRPFSWPPARC